MHYVRIYHIAHVSVLINVQFYLHHVHIFTERVSTEDREAAEREMHKLRVNLEHKIMSVNEQISKLREQQQEYLIAGAHKGELCIMVISSIAG